MTLHTIQIICIIWSLIGVGTFILLNFIAAPYGRHIKKGWGIEISNKLGWVLMEAPSLFVMVYFMTNYSTDNYSLMLGILWIGHYFNRTIIFPFRLHTQGKKMPITIVISAIFFNCINASLNGYFLTHFQPSVSFNSIQLVLGLTFFAAGFIINQVSDHTLIHLRKPEETGYKIPYGFMFKYISCPNHFGELIQWAGYGIMAWNFPAWTFFIWTAANLIPRALKHHSWYQSHFPNYPKNRKAIIPKVL